MLRKINPILYKFEKQLCYFNSYLKGTPRWRVSNPSSTRASTGRASFTRKRGRLREETLAKLAQVCQGRHCPGSDDVIAMFVVRKVKATPRGHHANAHLLIRLLAFPSRCWIRRTVPNLLQICSVVSDLVIWKLLSDCITSFHF